MASLTRLTTLNASHMGVVLNNHNPSVVRMRMHTDVLGLVSSLTGAAPRQPLPFDDPFVLLTQLAVWQVPNKTFLQLPGSERGAILRAPMSAQAYVRPKVLSVQVLHICQGKRVSAAWLQVCRSWT